MGCLGGRAAREAERVSQRTIACAHGAPRCNHRRANEASLRPSAIWVNPRAPNGATPDVLWRRLLSRDPRRVRRQPCVEAEQLGVELARQRGIAGAKEVFSE